jgi:prepilin-type N-terminal cleavage/methylation domain-containing protein
MEQGFTLIELLITTLVMTIGISGAFLAIQQGIIAVDYSNSRFTAAFLAQEGIEIVKNIRDTNLLEYYYISESIPWNEGLTTGAAVADFEVEYTDPQSLDPVLTEPICSPFCGFDDLRFLTKSKDGFYNYNGLEKVTKFKRKVRIEEAELYLLKIEVTVYWKGRGGNVQEIIVCQELYDWW